MRKDRSHGERGGLLIFIHRSITFSKQPSSPDSLSDPHLEELSIKAELGNTKLIISNVYIPPARSCSNGYHSSIEHLLTTLDTLIQGSKRHSLQVVELSQQTRTAVQIVSNPPAPSNGGPIYRFLGMPAMRTRWMAGAAAHKSG